MINPRDFRRALGCFATGVAVITARTTDGTALGITVNSFTSVSLDPPLVSWCLDKDAPSAQAFQRCAYWAVHVLGADQVALARRFASPNDDKIADLRTRNDDKGAPAIDGCIARIMCTQEHTFEGGDHVILVGRVEAHQSRAGAPLLFYNGQFHSGIANAIADGAAV